MENRETFFQRLKPFFVPSTLLDVELAYTLAKFSHRSQVRKEVDGEGQPVRYFEHIRRVALVLIDEAKIINREMVIASLLHDGMEDTRDLTPAMIEHCFGPDVTQMVMTLSKVPKDGYLERFYTSTDWRVYLIKACDRLDNVRSLSQASPAFQAKQIAETRDKYYSLFDRMVSLTPTEFRDRTQTIRDQVRQATERQTT